MRTQTIWVLFSSLVLAASACNDDANDDPANGESAKPAAVRPVVEQVEPPIDLKEPPKDATETASGLKYKKLVASKSGEMAKRSDTVMVRYTGWRQRTGETFFTTNRGGEAMGIDVAYASPVFGEALQQLRKGEKAVLWVPPGQGSPETLVYEVEVVDIKSSTAVASKLPDRSKPATSSQEATSGQQTASPEQTGLQQTMSQQPQAKRPVTGPQAATNAPKPPTGPQAATSTQKPTTSAQSQQVEHARPTTSAGSQPSTSAK